MFFVEKVERKIKLADTKNLYIEQLTNEPFTSIRGNNTEKNIRGFNQSYPNYH